MSETLLVPYRGYGTANTLYLKGRVLLDNGNTASTPDATALDNLLAAYRRLESDEVANGVVMASLAGQTWTAVTDGEGYFDFALNPLPAVDTRQIWHEVMLELAVIPRDQASVASRGQVLTPPPDAAFGVISDIDDTILVSHATAPLKAALTALLNSAQTRAPFPGVPALYRALQAGPTGIGYNPIFYVSSSPWNFYDVLTEFMAINGMPAGPLFLRDYGLQSLLEHGHRHHKLTHIDQLLMTFPSLPFVLLGDSGQEDPEIYATVVERNPGRIRAIYIRDVTDDERRQAVERLRRETETAGVDFVVGATENFISHALAHGLIVEL